VDEVSHPILPFYVELLNSWEIKPRQFYLLWQIYVGPMVLNWIVFDENCSALHRRSKDYETTSMHSPYSDYPLRNFQCYQEHDKKRLERFQKILLRQTKQNKQPSFQR
jgi:hypothetical protein